MSERDAMTWKDAEWWEKQELFYSANIHIIWQAIALARQEKARAEKAEKERDEEISEDADFWEKKAAKVEQRAMILDDQLVLLTEQCQRLEARLVATKNLADSV